MLESNVISQEDLAHTKAFKERALQWKTLQKLSKPSTNIQSFTHTFDKERIRKETKLQPGGFSES